MTDRKPRQEFAEFVEEVAVGLDREMREVVLCFPETPMGFALSIALARDVAGAMLEMVARVEATLQ